MFELSITVISLALGYFIGSAVEKKHYASIRIREQQLANLHVYNTKKLSEEDKKSEYATVLVEGHVVIAIDAFKKLSSALSSFFGGRVKAYESIIDRARREATLRMKEKAQTLKADKIMNFRIITSTIGQQQGDKGTGAAEAIAYGTAFIKLNKNS
ncbi:MAG TPA: heavy metal-binding domain-containing protein [Oligoflexia bacterium]|nr:heavy metal-binding domain-containing protein [Oligoflexia bacterium]HMR23895.1 heavy metal-binding domain-containing protein [Oligoflexia bacterium]